MSKMSFVSLQTLSTIKSFQTKNHLFAGLLSVKFHIMVSKQKQTSGISKKTFHSEVPRGEIYIVLIEIKVVPQHYVYSVKKI